jgi:3-oxoadipate enol-lactonase
VDEDGLIDAAGTRLAYRVWGSPGAAPLVLLHGLGEGAADWDGVGPAFGRTRRVYAPDLRGHGRSDWPGGYSVELMAADVAGFLDGLHLDQVDLIGHSMGGLVGYLLAGDHPDRVRRLILEDVAVLRPRERPAPEREPGELPYDWAMVLAIRGQIDRPEPAWLDRPGRITARTLVIGGGAASHVPQDWVADLAARIPGAELTTIDAGHAIHSSQPDAFTRTALAFLDPALATPIGAERAFALALAGPKAHLAPRGWADRSPRALR